MRRIKDVQERFWSKVRKAGPDECWIWTSTITNVGYGLFWCNKKQNSAHRMAWLLTHGPISDGLFILHSCDNRRCVNPSHLRTGTPLENMQDRDRKGRGVHHCGSQHSSSKLTEDQVKHIRETYDLKIMSMYKIAKEYNVHVMTIFDIIHRKIWKHI